MTPKEIILKTFKFQPAGIIPHLILIGQDMVPKLNKYYRSDKWQKKIIFRYFYGTGGGALEAGEYIGNDLVREPFGSIVKLGNIPHVVKPALDKPSFEGYRWPDIEELVDRKRVKEGLFDPANREKFIYAGLLLGYLERAMFIRGMENFLIDMIEHPDFVYEYTEGYLKLKLQLYDYINEIGEIDAVFGGGDDCDQRGCIMGLPLWRKFIKPCLEKEVKHAHVMGKYYYMHSCGNVMPIIDDLVDIGIDALEPIQPEPMDIFLLKNKLKGKVVMIGGMGAQSIIPFGNPADIRMKTKQLLAVLGIGGGYVLGNAKPMYKDTPVENAAAFIEEAMQGEEFI